MGPVQIMTYILIGAFAGFLSGLFGIGGGSIRIPLLYASGIPLLTAFGIDLLIIPFSSLAASFAHRKNIDFKNAKWVILGGSLGTIGGAFLIGSVPEVLLAVLFLIVAVLTVLAVYFRMVFPAIAKHVKPNARAITTGTFLINFLIVMRGGSGGSLFSPFLRIMGLDIREAIATSLFSTIFTSAIGAAVFWFYGYYLLSVAFFLMIGSVIGAELGSIASLKAKPHWLEKGLILFILLLAVFVLLKALL